MADLIRAAELHQRMPLKLGGAEIDASEFAPMVLGKQPLSTHNVDVNERPIAIVGAGDVYDTCHRPILDYRKTPRIIFDPGLSDSRKANILTSESTAIVQTQEELFASNPRYLLVGTPPKFHLPYIKEALKRGIPVVVEKPLVTSKEELSELDRLIKKSKTPIFCIDWEVAHATPLMYACGMKPPFTDALEGDTADKFSVFDFKNVVKIEGSLVEGDKHIKSNPKGSSSTGRTWLFDYRQGGGILFDMLVHVLNPLAVMGFSPQHIQDVSLGKSMEPHMPGKYTRFGKETGNTPTGETYGCANLIMKDPSGHEIPAFVEAGKKGHCNDGRIVLTDKKGYQLCWDAFNPEKDNKVILYDQSRTVLAKTHMRADCYALTFQHIQEWQKQAEKGGAPHAYYPEHRDMVSVILDMHDKARSQVPSREPLLQKALMEELQISAGGGALSTT